MSFIPLNGPGVNGALSVTSTASEVKVGSSRLEDRSIVTIQPLTADVWYGYDNGVTSSTGTKIFKGQVFPLEATSSLPVYVVAESGTVDVRITEVG